eukprot:3291400-Pleurochrysis_carterae.AAC.1
MDMHTVCQIWLDMETSLDRPAVCYFGRPGDATAVPAIAPALLPPKQVRNPNHTERCLRTRLRGH